MRCQDQVTMCADIVTSVTDDFRLRSGDTAHSITVVWVAKNDSYQNFQIGLQKGLGKEGTYPNSQPQIEKH